MVSNHPLFSLQQNPHDRYLFKEKKSEKEEWERKEPCKKFRKDSQIHRSHNVMHYINGVHALHSADKINLWITPYNTLEISLPSS